MVNIDRLSVIGPVEIVLIIIVLSSVIQYSWSHGFKKMKMDIISEVGKILLLLLVESPLTDIIISLVSSCKHHYPRMVCS